MKPIGEILLSRGAVDEADLEAALLAQKSKYELLGKILIGKGSITEEELLLALAEQFDITYMEKLPETIHAEEIKKAAPLNYLKKNGILPYRIEEDTIYVAISDPLNTAPLDDIYSLTGKKTVQALCSREKITARIHNLMEENFSSTEEVMEDITDENVGGLSIDLEEAQDLLDFSDEAPIIRLVNKLFYQAVRERASDIHIEPYESKVTVRFRIDGTLYEKLTPPKSFHSAIVSRLKVMAGLNIAERRLPQDGRIKIKIAGMDVDIRLSVIPTAFGERLVMRILDRASVLLGISDLGMGSSDVERFNRIINASNGIVLVTGPTGSGKTTTLYAAMAELNSPERNILTVEDPVEYQIAGIGQIPVNTKVGLTFARGLRSILRQDPDIVMVGEIRDVETAEIAIQASLTGHLVFSTLHTNDAASAVTRLVDMGVEAFLVSATVRAVIAQRLVRQICEACRESYLPNHELLDELGIKEEMTFYRGKGCEQCSDTGYRGRGAIYEIMTLSETVRRLIVESATRDDIRSEAIKGGMVTMREDGLKKIKEGITTPEEVLAATREVE
ncbi:MAG: type II secretion system ATPase GspE [Deltaproteobacteria bacterium]|nr:type II secretion system ATPase GspE [Deltaproteobacteria bacterium]